jgi:predicted O-methyltransferase YrrM
MMNQIIAFAKYYWKATTLHHIHSPFAYRILGSMLDEEKVYYDFKSLEELRRKLLKNQDLLVVEDYGAGSHVNNHKSRKVSSIAKSALSSKNQCQQIYRLIQELKSTCVLELGTSLGLSAAYMGKAKSNTQIHTIEGSPAIFNFANTQFKALGLNNILSYQGTFDDVLPEVLANQQFDLVFIDGHHDYKATLKYFDQIKKSVSKDCVFIFDDINWSKGMQEAWQVLKSNEEVTLSLDLFYYGILFFNTENQEREHHMVIPLKYKPFKLGFFN